MNRSYALNEFERDDIVECINIGVWRIELEKDKPPRMYGDSQMYSLLGAEQDVTPEQLYQQWYTNVEPTYLIHVNKAVEQILQEGRHAEVEYIWNHPQRGKTIVRCDGILSSRREQDKIVMIGSHRDITTKIIGMGDERIDHEILDYYKMSRYSIYLSSAYDQVFSLDIASKKVQTIAFKRGRYVKVDGSVPVYDVIERNVYWEDREAVRALFSEESIQKMHQENGPQYVDCRILTVGGEYEWIRGTAYLVEINGINEVLFVTKDVHHEYALKMLQQEKEDLLYAIIREEATVFKFDMKSQTLQTLNHKTADAEDVVFYQDMSLNELAEKLLVHYVDDSEKEKLEGFLSLEHIKDCREQQCKDIITLQMDAARYRYQWLKVSILTSPQLKHNVYLLLELMNRKEHLYPIIENYIRNTNDYFYFLDLKNDWFLRFLSGEKEHNMAPEEGTNYTQLIQKSVDKFVAEEDRERVKRMMSPEYILNRLQDEYEFSFNATVKSLQGELHRKCVTFKRFDMDKGYVLLQRTDITELYNKELILEKVQKESVTDAMTQLYNRLGSESMIERSMEQCSLDSNSAMLLLDLDNFKKANDTFGHPEGDRVLKEVARRLKHCFRAEDIVGRLGGDEYIVFLQSMSSRDDIHKVLDRVLEELQILCKNETDEVVVGASIGATFFEGQSYQELYKQADEALYCSKKKGKNTYTVYQELDQQSLPEKDAEH